MSTVAIQQLIVGAIYGLGMVSVALGTRSQNKWVAGLSWFWFGVGVALLLLVILLTFAVPLLTRQIR